MKEFSQAPVAKTSMLIRKPVGQVFEAFADPSVTTRFWFTRSSGRLETGKRVQWDWEMYGFSTNVNVLDIETNKRIVVEWGDEEGGYTTIEWTFSPRNEHETYVTIANSGFQGDGDSVVAQAIDSTEGFAFVLAGAKALLEHGVVLNLVGDKFPDAHVQ